MPSAPLVPHRLPRTAVLVLSTLTVLGAVLSTVLGIGLVPAGAAASRPVPFPRHPHGLTSPVKLPAEVEDLAPSQMQVSCNPVVQRGVRKLRSLALSTYDKGYDAGVVRSCVSGGTPSTRRAARGTGGSPSPTPPSALPPGTSSPG